MQTLTQTKASDDNSLSAISHSIEPIITVQRLPVDSSTGCKIVFERKLKIDLDAVKTFMEDYKTLIFDRTLNRTTVEDYMKQIMGSRWRSEQTTLMSAELDGVIYRINGQHFLTAYKNVVMNNKRFHNLTMTVNHIHYKVKTEEELRRLYGDTDGGKKRTPANKIQVYLYGTEVFPTFSKSTIKALRTGVQGHMYVYTLAGKFRLSVEEVARLMTTGEHYETCCRVGNFLQEGVGKHINRGPVWSAMFSTFAKYKEDSIEFWSKVNSQAELKSEDPRLMLAKKLSMTSVSAGRGGGSSKAHSAAPEEMYRWCIKAFNSWKNGTVFSFGAFNPEADRPVVH